MTAFLQLMQATCLHQLGCFILGYVGCGRMMGVVRWGRDFVVTLSVESEGFLVCRVVVLGVIVEVLPDGSFLVLFVWSPSCGGCAGCGCAGRLWLWWGARRAVRRMAAPFLR